MSVPRSALLSSNPSLLATCKPCSDDSRITEYGAGQQLFERLPGCSSEGARSPDRRTERASEARTQDVEQPARKGADPAGINPARISLLSPLISPLCFSLHLIVAHDPSTSTMSFGKVLSLSTGAKIPQIGLGTWLSKPNEVENAVSVLIDAEPREVPSCEHREGRESDCGVRDRSRSRFARGTGTSTPR